jgi:hypothetical protein
MAPTMFSQPGEVAEWSNVPDSKESAFEFLAEKSVVFIEDF